MRNKSRKIKYFLLLLLFVSVAAACLCLGGVLLPIQTIWQALVGDAMTSERVIVLSIRLPRMLAAVIAGAGLSISGILLQCVMANPLASPNTIGVNAGAGLSVIVALSLFSFGSAVTPIIAFIGAFATTWLILALSGAVGGGKSTVILAGIACTTLFQAGISLFSLLDDEVLSNYTAFSVGSLAGVEVKDLVVPAILIAGCWVAALMFSRQIQALSLGDFVAATVGIRVKWVRTLALLIASMSAAAVISFAGLLGFVGLVVPHIVRKLFGGNLRDNLLHAPMTGGILVMLSDLAGRTLFAPGELSVGVVMALLGAPFFFMILLAEGRGRRAGI